MSSVLIIGASGLLGQALVNSFIGRIENIGALSRTLFNHQNNSVVVHRVDVLELDSIEAIIKQYDVIINCIGQISNPISECLSLNTVGVSNIVNSVKKYNKKLIHISSVSVYGSSSYVDEESESNPETLYGCMKSFSEFLIKSNLDHFTILRVSNLFGNAQKKGIINYLEKSYTSNTSDISFNNDGSMKRYYLHVDDLVCIVNEVLINEITGTFNIVGSDQATILELVGMFKSILGFKFNASYANQSPIENIEEINCDKVKKNINIVTKNNLKSFINNIRK